MFRGDWLPGFAVVLILLFAAWVGLKIGYQQGHGDGGAAAAAYEENDAAGDGSLRMPEKNDYEAKRDYWREEEDLNAQRNMAYWASMMFAATAVSLFITGFGVFLVAKQLGLTRELFHLDKRPWIDARVVLFPDTIKWVQGGYFFHFSVKVSSHGQMPATNVRIAHFEFISELSPNVLSSLKDMYEGALTQRARNGVVVYPNAPPHDLLQSIRIYSDVKEALLDGYITGWVHYTFLGSLQTHATPFCWRVIFTRSGLDSYAVALCQPANTDINPT